MTPGSQGQNLEANLAKFWRDSGIAEAPNASAAHIVLPLRQALSVAALQPGESLLCGEVRRCKTVFVWVAVLVTAVHVQQTGQQR